MLLIYYVSWVVDKLTVEYGSVADIKAVLAYSELCSTSINYLRNYISSANYNSAALLLSYTGST